VIALAGGHADPRRIPEHCKANAAQDPIFCGVAISTENLASISRQISPQSATQDRETPGIATSVTDTRIRAVVAMATIGAPLTPEFLAAIKIPVVIYVAELDRFLVPKFHAERIAKDIPAAEEIPAFFDKAFN
jgi:predicted dienelactone hydrolase